MKHLVIAIAFIACCVASAADLKHRIDVMPGGGVFTQVVDGAEWKTSFYFHNMGTTTLYGIVFFSNDNGDDLPLPFSSGTTSYQEFTLSPNATTSFETLASGALKQGSALVGTCDRRCLDPNSQLVYGQLGAIAVFRWRATGRQEVEAVVPIEVPEKAARVLFDNRQGYTTGFALLNAATSSEAISITVRDNAGAVLTQETVTLGGFEKKVFMVAERYPNAAGKQGCIEISGRAVVALGLRASPNGALSSSHSMTPTF